MKTSDFLFFLVLITIFYLPIFSSHVIAANTNSDKLIEIVKDFNSKYGKNGGYLYTASDLKTYNEVKSRGGDITDTEISEIKSEFESILSKDKNTSDLNSGKSISVPGNATYTPLQTITLPNGDTVFSNTIEVYLQNIFTFGIALAGGLAVIRIVIAGIMYMLTDMVTKKEDAKDMIWSAIQGLLLALCSYVILYTINPELVKLKFELSQTETATTGVISGATTGATAGATSGTR